MRSLLDALLPAVYGIGLLLSLAADGGLFLPFLIIGALLLGLYYGVLRQRLTPTGGRDRRRNRQRRR